MYFLSQKISTFVARISRFSINDLLAAILAMTAKGALALLLAVLISVPPFGTNPLPSFASEYVQNNLVTNGTVYDIEVANGKVYLAGSFTQVGPNVGSGVPFDLTTGNLASKFPKVNRIIRAVVPDGFGGWFIGGDFTLVGGLSRNGIAHIFSDGTVDPNWDPNVAGISDKESPKGENWDTTPISMVYALAVRGSTLYVGGSFTKIGVQSRNSLAAIDTGTGEVISWNPNVTGAVKTLAISGSSLYVGGAFTKISGQPRNNLAAIDISTGNVTGWDPSLIYSNNSVNIFAINGTTLYIGGEIFVFDDKQIRYGLIAIDLITGDLLNWNPNFDHGSEVKSIIINDSTLYVGGYFYRVGGKTRSCLAAIDLLTGNVTSFNPNIASRGRGVDSLAVYGSTLYIGGDFIKVDKESRNNLAAIDLVSEVVTSWNPNVGRKVHSLAVSSNSSLYAGGEITTVGGQPRSIGIAAIDVSTGELTSWVPNIQYIGGVVKTLKISGSTLFIGGYFSTLGDLYYRGGLAAIDLNTGNITAWNPKVEFPGQNAYINDILINNSTLYVGGNFTSINGQPRYNLAAFDITSGNLTNLRQDIYGGYGGVYTLEADGSNLYIGGNFSTVGGQPRDDLAAVDLTTGDLTNWNPIVLDKDTSPVGHLSYIRALATRDSILYSGGRYTTRGFTKYTLTAFDASTGDNFFSAIPNVDGSVNALAIKDSTLYVGGLFIKVGKEIRNQLAAINVTTGEVTGWNPDVGVYAPGEWDNWAPGRSNIKAIAASNEAVYIGGNFTSIGNEVISHFAKLSPSRATTLTNSSSTPTSNSPKSTSKDSTSTSTSESTTSTTTNTTTLATDDTTLTTTTTTSTSETTTIGTTTSTTESTTSTTESTTSTSETTTPTTTTSTTLTDTTTGNGRPEGGRPAEAGSNGNAFGKNK